MTQHVTSPDSGVCPNCGNPYEARKEVSCADVARNWMEDTHVRYIHEATPVGDRLRRIDEMCEIPIEEDP